MGARLQEADVEMGAIGEQPLLEKIARSASSNMRDQVGSGPGSPFSICDAPGDTASSCLSIPALLTSRHPPPLAEEPHSLGSSASAG